MKSRATLPSYNFHILETYLYLRLGMAIVAFAFPLVLWLGGDSLGIGMRESMSDYYHTNLRNAFVGMLFAIGLCLMMYKGFSKREDWALNIAGALAIAIALVPTAVGCMSATPLETLKALHPSMAAKDLEAQVLAASAQFDRTFDVLLPGSPKVIVALHGTFAFLFCVVIGYVCAYCSKNSLVLVKEKSLTAYRAFSWIYGLLGYLLPGLALVVALISWFDPQSRLDCRNFTVFRVEFAVVWVFSAFWAIKTWEIHRYGTDYEFPNRRAVPEPD